MQPVTVKKSVMMLMPCFKQMKVKVEIELKRTADFRYAYIKKRGEPCDR